MHMLQNAAHPLQELCQVKNQANQLQAFHGRSMSYKSYCNLLLSAASNYDAQFAPKSKSERFGPKSTKREVYTHDLHDSYDSTSNNGSYNLDSSIVELQANLHEQQSKIPGKAPQLTGHSGKA